MCLNSTQMSRLKCIYSAFEHKCCTIICSISQTVLVPRSPVFESPILLPSFLWFLHHWLEIYGEWRRFSNPTEMIFPLQNVLCWTIVNVSCFLTVLCNFQYCKVGGLHYWQLARASALFESAGRDVASQVYVRSYAVPGRLRSPLPVRVHRVLAHDSDLVVQLLFDLVVLPPWSFVGVSSLTSWSSCSLTRCTGTWPRTLVSGWELRLSCIVPLRRRQRHLPAPPRPARGPHSRRPVGDRRLCSMSPFP